MRLAWLVVGLAGCTVLWEAPDAEPTPIDAGPPPTYSFLYDHYFAAGTPGHCAKSGCHLGTPTVHVWVCGATKEQCYAGMVKVRLIDPAHPSASLIIDPQNSPLSWFNPNGAMPQDGPGPFPEGRDAIAAWVAAGALDD